MTFNNDINSGNNLLTINKSDCIYTSCYCEENIWKLCQLISNNHKNHLNNCFVVFISNDNKVVPIWKQRAGNEYKDYLCVWDYHVIMVYVNQIQYRDQSLNNAVVYDLDTILSFPEDFHRYSEQTFRNESTIRAEYHRMFRVIEAEVYLNRFASNRCHMKGEDGSWLKTPPNYPCIKTDECDNENNLDQFISMDLSNGFGTVLNLNQLNHRFNQ